MNPSNKNQKLHSTLKTTVSKIRFTILAFLISLIVVAQNGINYKALIKDANGNVLASSPVSLQFIIYEGDALTNNVYQESHTINTDTNGFVIVNIGEGTTGNDFNTINWGNDEHFLNVQVNTGSGLVDLGTIAFTTVPYAKIAENVKGLEALNEGNGIGWRLVGKNPDRYGDIGEHAIDLSAQGSLDNRGATGQFSFAAGAVTIANAPFSVAFGEGSSSTGSAAFSAGRYSFASGDYSTALGSDNTASGTNSTAMGFRTQAEAYASTAIGRYNVGGGNATGWSIFDPLFEIGNGTSGSERNNALTVNKSGFMRLNSSLSGLEVSSDGTYGIRVNEGNLYGGTFRGEDIGVFAKATNNANPDIVLGGDSGNNIDDGILTSDPSHPSSDLLFRSYDDVIIELDDNDNESGAFIVRDGDDNGVFSVTEDGTIRQNGSTIHASDRRLKKDIENLEYGLKEVLQLQPKQYFWKNKDNQKQKSLGLIAQEVRPIIQNVVLQGDDDLKTLGVSYTELIPVLIKAIQELKQENNTLKINLEQKDRSLNNLTERVKSIEQLLKSLSK